MQDGEVGVYPGPDGETYVTFKAGDKGLPLMQVPPASAQGEAFGSFPVAGYFNYVSLWMATKEQWQSFGRRTTGAQQAVGVPSQHQAPPIDLAAYDIRKSDGSLDKQQLARLLFVMARLYDHEPLISPQAGLFHSLFRSGLTPDEIFQHITEKGAQGQANIQNVVRLDRVQTDTGFRKKAADTLSHAAGRAASKQLKKKRKQGRVNRKHGRR